jgi:NADH-quinone oxidoreductase E subunit
MATSIEEIVSRYKQASRESLLPLLQDIQDEFGYLSEESIVAVSEFLKLPVTKVYGIASFYDQFRFIPPGKFHLKVCRGTACHVRDSVSILRQVQKILKIEEGQVTRDGMFSLEVVSCIGACGMAPVISVNGHFHSVVSPDDLARIIGSYRN